MNSARSGSAGAHRLGELPLFAGLPLDALDQLARESRLRRFPKGQVLCSEGDPGESLIALEEGQVVVSRIMAGGQEVVLATLEPPAAFGELSLLDGAPRSATVTAHQPVVVRAIARTTFLALLGREPSLAQGLLRTLAGMVRANNERLSDVLTLDVPGRVAKWLLARAAATGERTPRGVAVQLGRSQGELAAELGATRVSINRALQSFAALGLLDVDGGQVVIRRPEELADYVG